MAADPAAAGDAEAAPDAEAEPDAAAVPGAVAVLPVTADDDEPPEVQADRPSAASSAVSEVAASDAQREADMDSILPHG
jgi:hypothetical protein